MTDPNTSAELQANYEILATKSGQLDEEGQAALDRLASLVTGLQEPADATPDGPQAGSDGGGEAGERPATEQDRQQPPAG
jgi:hypothetical protein